MLRQNRDLAKSNNVRALRIRELESECALMLSENLELRSRVLELEAQVENNEARRIADHALAIKARLEAQLTEWGSLLSSLGMEPPMKRRSPEMRKTMKHRMSFCPGRPSPSQRRLRDIARDIEELGSISERRSSSRQSLNPEQIRAMRVEAESAVPESPSKLRIIEQPESESPTRRAFAEPEARSVSRKPIEPPISFPSPNPTKKASMVVLLPEKKKKPESIGRHPVVAQPSTLIPEHLSTKAGSKRKFAQHEESPQPHQSTDENESARSITNKVSVRDKAGGKTLKELSHIRKVARETPSTAGNGRKPLAAKSTNDDFSSPRKVAKSAATDEVSAAKAELAKSKPPKDRQKLKSKIDMAPKIQAISVRDSSPPHTVIISNDELIMSVSEPVLLSSNSPEPMSRRDEARGDTPPPADISLDGEASRPSRRNRTTVSYAEPNLRAKMRRPTKELFDAVTGEGKYARRVSQCDQQFPEEAKSKRESVTKDSLSRIPDAINIDERKSPEPDSEIISSFERGSPAQEVSSVASTTERPRRHSRPVDYAADISTDPDDDDDSGDVDVYEFTSSSPHIDKDGRAGKAAGGRRQGAVTRRRSAVVDSDKGTSAKDRSASRRRSMVV
ncbi:hypothetical protein E4U39_003646 [Claviceps sp. Clav50 group G5]|nr:hypothetical protein E4U39_003646 [Claviceps sp. Clav50 group G5]